MREECLPLGERLSRVWQHLLSPPACMNLGSEASTIVSVQQTFTVTIIPTLASYATYETLLTLAWAAF